MTIIHKGIRRMTTDVLADYSQAHYLQNVSMKRVGEISRRAGIGKSTMAKLDGPVLFMINGWSNVPFIVNGSGATIYGTASPYAYWTALTMRIPGGRVGQPVAPVINSVTATPASGAVYVVGQVALTANITYDNLSGPLLYEWTLNTGGPNQPAVIVDNAIPGILEFDVACIPGDYTDFSLIVTTTNDPLLTDTFNFDYTVTA